LVLLWATASSAQADDDRSQQPEVINIGISSKEIAIAPDFAGTDVTVFGAIDHADPEILRSGGYDLVVSLEGPRDFITVRKKDRVAGVWVNRHSVTFQYMPESYSMASTRAIDAIAKPTELFTFNVGLPRAKLVPSTFSGRAEEVTEYRDAFLALKERVKLYQSNPGGVTFISSSLFQANIHIPADIPNGTHTIRAVLFRKGIFVAEKQMQLEVVKTGIEETITFAATKRPLFYGIFAVMLAVLTGWAASLIFRKD
jgi:uncharacterized protein (TIGR02186 family)